MKDKKNSIFSEDIPTINTDIIDVDVDNSDEPETTTKPTAPQKAPTKRPSPPQKTQVKNSPSSQRGEWIYRILFIIIIIIATLSVHILISKNTSKLNSNIQHVSDSLKVYSAKINTHSQDTTLQELEKRITQNSELLFQINAELNRKKLDEQGSILKLEKANRNLKGENQILKASIQNLQKKSTNINQYKNTYTKQIKSLENQLKIVKQGKQDIQNDNNSLKLKIRALEAQYNSLNNDKLNLSKLNDRIHSDFSKIKKDFDKLKKVNETHLADLIQSQEVIKQLQEILKKNRIKHSIKLSPTKQTAPPTTPKILQKRSTRTPFDPKASKKQQKPQQKTVPKKKKVTPSPVEEEKDNNLLWVW